MQGPFAPGFVGANQLFAGGAVEWRTADAHFPEASGEATVRDALRAYTMRGGGNYFWW
jgi:hypothetical protein